MEQIQQDLVSACATNDAVRCQQLITDGAKIITDDNSVFTTTCEAGSVDVMEVLLKNGLKEILTDPEAVLWASENSTEEIAKMLEEYGVDYQLSIARLYATEDQVVEYILEANPKDKLSYLIRRAGLYGITSQLVLLSELGEDLSVGGDQALRVAAIQGHTSTVKYLLSKGANVNVCNDNATSWASSANHLETVKCLIAAGGGDTDKLHGSICNTAIAGHLDMIEFLIKQDCVQPRSLRVATIAASGNGHLGIVKCLVKAGAVITDNIAINQAHLNGKAMVVEYLKKKGCKLKT